MSINKEMSTEDLEKELKRRKEESAKADAPQLVAIPDIEALRKLAISIEEDRIKGREGKDDEHWCYEGIMQAFYGKDYFNKIS